MMFLAWAPWLERLSGGRADRDANVIARKRAAARRVTLILMAHHDSKSQADALAAVARIVHRDCDPGAQALATCCRGAPSGSG